MDSCLSKGKKDSNWEKKSEKYIEKALSKQNTDPYTLKKEYLGKNAPISRYDLYVDKVTGVIGIVEKASGKLVVITDYFIGNNSIGGGNH